MKHRILAIQLFTCILAIVGHEVIHSGVLRVEHGNTPTLLVNDDVVTVRGRITDIDLEGGRFVVITEFGEHVRIHADEATRYTLEGQEVTKEEALKQGATATVRHVDGRAVVVDVMSLPETTAALGRSRR